MNLMKLLKFGANSKERGEFTMPVFIQYKTAKTADKIMITKNNKALIVLKNGKVKFYPKTNYNLSICAQARRDINHLVRYDN